MATPQVCIWEDQNVKWFWDQDEDSGGFDRCVPMGHFDDFAYAYNDVFTVFPHFEYKRNAPEHYA